MDVSTQQKEDALATTAKGAPITFERPVPTDLPFEKPYVPRALAAVDSENPYGTPGHSNDNLSVLQQHVAFFDLNNDGLIYPWETYQAFRLLGFNVIWSLLAPLVINFGFSYSTVPGWLPSPLFVIYVRNIHKAKHESDSGVYDSEGRFVPSKFEEIFTKYAKADQTRFTFKEVFDMTQNMRVAFDPFGWFANKFEWGISWLLAKDEDGYLSKEAIRGMYDGSFFEFVKKDVKAKKEAKLSGRKGKKAA